MGARHIIEAAVAVLVFTVALTPATGSGQVEFADDDGIPEERNIEQVVDLGLLAPCDAPANSRFCPRDPARTGEVADSLMGAAKALGRIPDLPVEAAARGLARVPAALGLTEEEAVPRWALSQAAGYLFETRVSDLSSADPAAAVDRAELADLLAVAIGMDRCPDDPFTEERVVALADRHPRQSLQAYAYDTRTGCAYWMNPEERLRPASVFKVMVLAGTLLEAQQEDREVAESEMARLIPMITESANWPVRSLWRSFGAAPWFSEQTEIFGLEETNAVGDYGGSWGGSRTSAKDQADLLRQVLLGDWGPLDPEYRQVARDLMTSVIESQTWGVSGGVPEGWTVAQKNGFAGSTANSVGYVEQPGGGGGYVVAVLTSGWPGWRAGVDTVEEISGWVAGALAHEASPTSRGDGWR
jgi:beta-lactamase class A